MNLPYSPPAQRLSRVRAARPAAVAILYPKVGNVLRVPLRRTRRHGAQGCAQHPERQFISWFTRMTAAQPGFPMQLKSILLLTGEPLCESCRRTLTRYLGQYRLASKLRIRSRGEVAGCNCQQFSVVAHLGRPAQPLDVLLLESELEAEGWWQRAKDLGRTALLAGALTLGPQAVPKPVYDLAKAAAQAEEKRRKMQQTVEQHAPDSRPSPTGREVQELETSLFAQELEAGLSQEVSVIHPNIDVHAQYALQRMLASPDPAARVDGNELLAAVRGGQLRGIYKEDQQVPALRAKAIGKGWWQIIPPPEDAVLFTSPQEAPLLVFRDRVRSDAVRLDPALRKAWQAYRLQQQGRLAPCPRPSGGLQAEVGALYVPVQHVVPPLCQLTPAGGCTQPSAPIKGSAKVKGIKFDFNLSPLAFNPRARGAFKPSSVSPGKMIFSCLREAVSGECLNLITPAWSYNAVVSTSDPTVKETDWEFGFIQNLRRTEIQHHYTNSKARKSVVVNALDVLPLPAPGSAPWYSPQSVKKLSDGTAATLEDSPNTKAPLLHPSSPTATLDQVCYSGTFDVWLAVRQRSSNTLVPLALKRIEFARMWRRRNPPTTPGEVGDWLVFGGQREVPVPGQPPAFITKGPRAHQLDKFEETTTKLCPEPPDFPELCLVGEQCMSI